METHPLILQDMQKLGLDPAAWRYDRKSHRYVQLTEDHSAIPPRATPPVDESWDPVTGAKMPSTKSLIADALGDTWDTVNKPLVEINPRMTSEDIRNPVARGAINAVSGAVNSLTSPLGLATLPLASARVVKAIPSLAQTAGVGMVGLGGASGYQAGNRIYQELKADHPADVEMIAESAGQLAFAPLMIKGGTTLSKAGTAAKPTPPAAAATVQTSPPVMRGLLGEELNVPRPVDAAPIALEPTAPVSTVPIDPNFGRDIPKVSRKKVISGGTDPFNVAGEAGEPIVGGLQPIKSAQPLDANFVPIETAPISRDVLGVAPGEVAGAPIETGLQPVKTLQAVDPNFAPIKQAKAAKPIVSATDPFGVTGSKAPAPVGEPKLNPDATIVKSEAPIPTDLTAPKAEAPAEPTMVEKLEADLAARRERLKLAQEAKASGVARNNIVNGIRRAEAKLEQAKKGLQVQPRASAEGGFIDTRAAIDAVKRVASGMSKVAQHGLEVARQQIPAVKQLPFRGADLLGDTLDNLFTKRREYARYANEFRAVINDKHMAAAERAQAAAIADKRAKNFDASNRLDADAKYILDGWRATLKKMRQDQIASGQPVWDASSGNVRQAGLDPFYFPEVVARDVLSAMKRGKGDQYKQDFIDYRMRQGSTRDAATAELNEYLNDFDIYGQYGAGGSTTFGAVRKVEGRGIPDSWIDPNPDRALNRYANNFGRDRAFYDTIEKNHDVMAMLGKKQDYYGNPVKSTIPDLTDLSGQVPVKRALEEYFGIGSDISNPVIRGMQQLVHSTIIGIPSKVTDVLGVARMATFLPNGVAGMPGMLKNLASLDRLSKAASDAIEQGISRRTLGVKDTAHNLINNISAHHETWGEAFTEVANMVQHATQQQHLEIGARTLAQAAGEYVGKLHVDLAKLGNPESVAFLRDLFGDRWQGVTHEQMGARIAELNQGTYDARSLPYIPPSIRPFSQLARWSIEQAYHTKKYMLDPALRGNINPLVAGTASSLAAGSIANAIITELTGVQNSIPTEEEIAAAPEKEQGKLRAYKLIALSQIVGFGGIVSTLTKGMLDKFVMHVEARGFTYPLYEVASNAAKQTTAAAEAISQGEDATRVLGEYFSKMTLGNSQTLRFLQQVALNTGATDEFLGQSKDVANRREDYRNRRMYQITQGLPVPPMMPPRADYSNLEVREFKRTSDAAAAAKQVPELLNRAVRRSAGDPSALKKEVHNLRVLPIHSMPDPETDRAGFQLYYQWLVKTKGPTEARATVARYAKLKAANAAKQEMIPKID